MSVAALYTDVQHPRLGLLGALVQIRAELAEKQLLLLEKEQELLEKEQTLVVLKEEVRR